MKAARGGWRHTPETVVLDIDDTVDVVHGHQQLSLFNAAAKHEGSIFGGA
jgi:hypothetical protein